jgi:hypothetical protein
MITAGAAATLRLFGPESMGGQGDFGPMIAAEIARTGLSEDEVGPKVHYVFHIILLDGLADVFIFKRYFITQKENWSNFQVFLQCMITNFTRRRYVSYLS